MNQRQKQTFFCSNSFNATHSSRSHIRFNYVLLNVFKSVDKIHQLLSMLFLQSVSGKLISCYL